MERERDKQISSKNLPDLIMESSSGSQVAATGPTLLDLPLEIRHRIFGFVSQTEEGPKKIMQRWFETMEIREYDISTLYFQEPADLYGEYGMGAFDAENDGSMGEEDPNVENDDGYNDDEQVHDGNGHAIIDTESNNPELEEDDEIPQWPEPTSIIPRRSGSPYRASTKWRHVPPILQISHTPPPLSLLLTNRQLCKEATSYFYNAAYLCINATANFQHHTFFKEEVFDNLYTATHSPLHQIQKIEIMFSWDTEWFHFEETKNGAEDESFRGIEMWAWEFELNDRAETVVDVMLHMPNLHKAKITWRDSQRTVESFERMRNVMATFDEVRSRIPDVDIEVIQIWEDSYDGVEQHSVMGKQRKQFQEILENGQQFP